MGNIRQITYTLDIEPTIKSIAFHLRIHRMIPGNEVGGSLHIYSDDGNCSDENIKFCLREAKDKQDSPSEMICECLLRMNKDQRKAAYERFQNRYEDDSK